MHKILKICLFVSTESTNVMDGRTDTAPRHSRSRRLCTASQEVFIFAVNQTTLLSALTTRSNVSDLSRLLAV